MQEVVPHLGRLPAIHSLWSAPENQWQKPNSQLAVDDVKVESVSSFDWRWPVGNVLTMDEHGVVGHVATCLMHPLGHIVVMRVMANMWVCRQLVHWWGGSTTRDGRPIFLVGAGMLPT